MAPRWRILTLSFLLATCLVGLGALSVQPVLLRLGSALARFATPGSPERTILQQIQAVLPLYLGGALVAGILLSYVLLHFVVQRPLRELEGTIEQLGRAGLEGGPFPRSHGATLLTRVDAALSRLTEALRSEQTTTRRQLTALREANDRLSRAQLELITQERLATVGRLAAGVAHEVGNPLAGILGYLSLAKARTRDPQLSDFLVRIEGEVARIDGIVRSLLDLGRSQRPAAGPLGLRHAIDACVHLVQSGPELREVSLRVEVDGDVRVLAEPGALAQILINLALNAGQAMQGRGTLAFRAQPSGDRVLLHVEDTGPGIDPEALPRVFEPFFSTKAPGAGSGLGLAVSLHLAAALEGTLSAANREEGGARFTLSLPRA